MCLDIITCCNSFITTFTSSLHTNIGSLKISEISVYVSTESGTSTSLTTASADPFSMSASFPSSSERSNLTSVFVFAGSSSLPTVPSSASKGVMSYSLHHLLLLFIHHH